ncbi:ABC transporter permease [Roseomonas sp. CCTCC AB2023176]|uniref:ABC transporter permease n=1 Tax=Roseomonas sp. CCTCC AB2023176 TaxID=3342640 RepID=UPI0035E0BC8E
MIDPILTKLALRRARKHVNPRIVMRSRQTSQTSMIAGFAPGATPSLREEFAAFVAGARTASRVVGALFLREMKTRFGRSRIGYLWAVLEPISHVAVMSFVYWAINRRAPVGDNVILFFVTGVLPYFLFQKTAQHLGGAIRGNHLVLRMPLVTGLDLVVARALLEAATWVAVVLLIFGFLILSGRAALPEQPLVCALAAFVTFAFGFGVGTINAVLMTVWKSWVLIYPMLTRPLYHFSAIFFFIDRIPANLRDWLSWNPLTHAVGWFRVGYVEAYGSVTLDPAYLIKWTVGAVIIGLCMERAAQRAVQSG